VAVAAVPHPPVRRSPERGARMSSGGEGEADLGGAVVSLQLSASEQATALTDRRRQTAPAAAAYAGTRGRVLRLLPWLHAYKANQDGINPSGPTCSLLGFWPNRPLLAHGTANNLLFISQQFTLCGFYF
jgi:hypothetical protein